MLAVRNGLASPISQFWKRAFDLAVSSTLLLMLSPIFVILPLLIARDGGPVFISHSRVGRGGRVFGCLKFRGMVPNADEVLGADLANEPHNDPRKTWIGDILRSTGLDELPQLLNVLRGDMSLVGPRPVAHDELHRCDGASDACNLTARPGITGVWQVRGRPETGYDERVDLDDWYVRNWSMWKDVMVLCRTMLDGAVAHSTGRDDTSRPLPNARQPYLGTPAGANR